MNAASSHLSPLHGKQWDLPCLSPFPPSLQALPSSCNKGQRKGAAVGGSSCGGKPLLDAEANPSSIFTKSPRASPAAICDVTHKNRCQTRPGTQQVQRRGEQKPAHPCTYVSNTHNSIESCKVCRQLSKRIPTWYLYFGNGL